MKKVRAIVVGTGFGGAVAACRLSQAGFEPLVLERGRRYQASDFPALPQTPALGPDLRRWTWHGEQGLWDVQDLDEIISVQAAGYGGGSLIYANVHLRPAPKVFDHRWPEVYRGGKELQPFYNLVASMLNVAPVADGQRRDRVRLKDGIPAKAAQLEEAARSRGRQGAFFYPPLAVTYEDTEDNGHQRAQKACVSCGSCCSGCPHKAKNTLDFNYLAVAEQRGAKVQTQCEVLDILRCPVTESNGHLGREIEADDRKDNQRGWIVEYVDHLTAQKVKVETEYLFLCAGAVHSTRLLARLKLPKTNASEQLKANIGLGYFPNADALGIVYDTEHKQYPSWGPTITNATVHEREAGQAGGENWFMVQDGGYAAELERLMGGFRASIWAGRNRYQKLGDAQIPPTKSPPPPVAKPVLRADQALTSPVDAVLDAMAQNAFDKAVPRQLHGSLHDIAKELVWPFLPDIVDRTLEHAIEANLRSCWLTRWWLKPKWRLFGALVRLLKWITYWVMGSRDMLSGDALRALLEGGGLSRNEIASRVLGYDDGGAARRMMLLTMGKDEAVGRLDYDPAEDTLRADLDLYHLAPLYAQEELAMRDIAQLLGGELRVNPAWSFLGKPITVHSQGGCPMSTDPEKGVTTPDGQVHGCPGLYVLDGSILCSSVGVNPSATIAAIAERNMSKFLEKNSTEWLRNGDYQLHRAKADAWFEEATKLGWSITPPQGTPDPSASHPLGLTFHERMQGFCGETNSDPQYVDDVYRKLENDGRPNHPVTLELDIGVQNLAAFFEDMRHVLDIVGKVTMQVPGDTQAREFDVRGNLQLMVDPSQRGVPKAITVRHKDHGLDWRDGFQLNAIRAFRDIAQHSYRTVVDRQPAPEQRFMYYTLSFVDLTNQPWRLEGYKRLRDEPGPDAWRDTTWLFLRLMRDTPNKKSPSQGNVCAAGVVHIDLPGFLSQLNSIRVVTGGESDPKNAPELADSTRMAWTIASFGAFFFGNLQRVYLPRFTQVLDALGRPPKKRRVS